MFNLFDILQNQAGPGMQTIGQQFGLTPEQSRSAMNALLPAIAAGLQHNAASDPMGFGRMLGMAGPNQFYGTAPQAPSQVDFLGQLFGSPMVSQAVLQQASAASGIGQQALRQVLPVMAGMVVAGIVHVMINQPPAPTPQRPAPKPASPNTSFPGADLWSDWFDQFVVVPNPSTSNAGKAPAPATLAVKSPATQPGPDKPAAAPTAQDQEGKEAPFEAFQQIFQTGVQVQEQNVKAMQEIFDAFWSKPPETPDASEMHTSKVSSAQEVPADNGSAADSRSNAKPASEKLSGRRKIK